MTHQIKTFRRLILSGAIYALSSFGLSGNAWAEITKDVTSYPNKPIKIVDGFAAGGSTDTLVRILGKHLSEALGQPIVIDNKAGAGGIVATTFVARAPADGYTLLLGTIGPIAVNPHIVKNIGYKPLEDLAPIISLVDVANVLVVRNEHPAKNIADLVEIAKKNPKKINYGSAGIGTTGHLAGAVFEQQAHVELTHVPYRGGAPAMTGLLSGETDMIFSSIPTAVEHINSGRLRALAVTGKTELETLPGIKTMKDAGVTHYVLPSWYGLFAPTGTPQPIIDKLEREFTKVLTIPEVKKQLIMLGMVPDPVPAAKFKQQLAQDSKYWQGVLEKANISAH